MANKQDLWILSCSSKHSTTCIPIYAISETEILDYLKSNLNMENILNIFIIYTTYNSSVNNSSNPAANPLRDGLYEFFIDDNGEENDLYYDRANLMQNDDLTISKFIKHIRNTLTKLKEQVSAKSILNWLCRAVYDTHDNIYLISLTKIGKHDIHYVDQKKH